MDPFARIAELDDAELLELREMIVRRQREISLHPGQAVFLLVEGSEDLWLAKVMGAFESAAVRLGPEVDVFAAGDWPSMFLTATGASEAHRIGEDGRHVLEVRTGLTNYTLQAA